MENNTRKKTTYRYLKANFDPLAEGWRI